ncbi:MAG: DUF6544 family protein [Vicinamibacterales bacterium]
MLELVGLTAAVVAAAVGAAVWYGAARWAARTRELRTGLAESRVPVRLPAVDLAGLASVPPPVQRFFRAVLTDGQPRVAAVRLRHMGTFNMGETTDRWTAFTSDQQVIARRPGFDWDARMALLPGLSVRVHDAYVAGSGILQASVLGLYAVADLRGGGDLAAGELMRFLAEAAWYPTVLLPGQDLTWTAVDDRTALATLTDGPVVVTLRFTFHEDGPIDTVSADARARTVAGASVPTPWQGRFWNYEVRDGMRIPLDGEVAWLLPDGPKVYWRGRITDVAFEFEQ